METHFQILMEQLKSLELNELINLYLEAKTGKPDFTDLLPCTTLDLIYELEELINPYCETETE